jgi:citrate lyase beta subunit
LAPDEADARQPVHTVYGGGHLFRADTASKLGQLARRALDEFAPWPGDLARACGLPDAGGFGLTVERRVRDRLEREAVEDFRIDFEDGYGARSDAEEDGHVDGAARQLASGLRDGLLPRCIGIRVKSLTPEWRRRSSRTLERFVHSVIDETGGTLPGGFVVTVPKVTSGEEVSAVAAHLDALEERCGLARGTVRVEIMVETPQILMDADGRCPLRSIVAAGGGRVSAAHFGTYDYTASLGIAAGEQRMRHPACQHALRVMQMALAGTGVWLCDGSTAVLPVPIHRAVSGGPPLGPNEAAENRERVHGAWRLHYDDVRHSLSNGLYQGWDLHPAQLPTRYAALFAFFLEGFEPAAARLRNFVEQAARATLVGDVFDDAATGQGLLTFFLRGIAAGAFSADDVSARTGLTTGELGSRSFVTILAARTARARTA